MRNCAIFVCIVLGIILSSCSQGSVVPENPNTPEPTKIMNLTPGDFRYVNWGTSQENVKENEPGSLLFETSEILEYEVTVSNLKFRCTYFFNKNGELISASYKLDEDDKTNYEKYFKLLKDEMTEKYGPPITDIDTIGEWKTLNTEIMMVLMGDMGIQKDLNIQYKSVEYSEYKKGGNGL